MMNKMKQRNSEKAADKGNRADTIIGLIKAIKREHLCSVEFLEDSIKIKKQLGNNTGSKIEIEFSESKRIESINFVVGGYNEPNTLKREFSILFDIIFKA